MNILKKDHPLSILILADHLIAAGEELYAAFIHTPPQPLIDEQLNALTDYANASRAFHRALKQPEHPHVTSSKPPIVPGA